MPVLPARRGLHGPQSTARVRQRREAVCGGREAGPRPRSGAAPEGRTSAPERLHDMGNWSRQPEHRRAATHG
ncbi:hypothetical protein SHJG_6946 [Streptomyces hygroscopicus subsp. jinggangensis 5008]|nr:hypothetical protein SHJG_6946 [Streptomyces hygroscopicus subsp. jinggangensis 5008]AGF66368.1 hypothetical protein SHJGH_6706 [Streptomyces hygroscopicus subsp. jinggangensis TL01]